MTPEDAFVHDIVQAPDDDALRLIYADWLEDHGQPGRAEFIRVQIERAALTLDDPRHAALAEREADLLAEHGGRWREPYVVLGARRVEFRRGLVEVAEFDTTDADAVREAMALAPVRDLRLGRADAAGAAAVADLPELARLRSLRFHSRRALAFGGGGAQAVADSPHLAGLTSLDITQCAVGVEGVRALAGSPRLGSLTELTLRCNDLTDDSAVALAESPLPPRLRHLSLGWNYLSVAGVAAMLPACANLETLDLDENNLRGPEVARSLAAATHLRRLSYLHLGLARIGPDGAAALAGAAHLASLRTLVVQHCDLGDDGVRLLAGSPHLAGLRALWMCGNAVTHDGIAALGESVFWPGLRSLVLNDASLTDAALEALRDAPSLAELSLWDAAVGPAGMAALARLPMPRLGRLDLYNLAGLGDDGAARLLAGPGLTGLRHLTLSGTKLTAAGVAALAREPGLARLASLELTGQPFRCAGAAALAASPHVAGLREIALTHCGIGDEGASALAGSPHLGGLRALSLHQNPIDPAGAGRDLVERFGDRVRFSPPQFQLGP